MVLLDLDLVSCYTSVLVGLYPDKLPLVKRAVETVGIWKFIENEFKQKGKESKFEKTFVKICFYSVIFGGGTQAMVDAIVAEVQKRFGMTKKEFTD